MMATPRDLKDFAVGFSVSEGIVSSAAEICSLEVLPLDDGVELRMWLSEPKADRLRERRRRIAGPTGCGLCGIESIAEAMRPASVIRRGRQFSPEQIMVAMLSLPSRQKLNNETRAVHAAAFWNDTSGIVAVREDVGRHNALDKLSGALARTSVVASEGIILLTSRVSVEMVQKSAAIGASRDGVGFSADGAGCSHGRCRGHHACGDRACGRISRSSRIRNEFRMAPCGNDAVVTTVVMSKALFVTISRRETKPIRRRADPKALKPM